jgi:hypothetical protein
MVDAKLRAWWSHKQGLDSSLGGQTPAAVLDRTGWARSIGGAGPYLTLFSRAGLRRADVDAAIAKAEIQELPSARGCTYVLPASGYALGLKVGQPFGEAELKTARKLGVTDGELAHLRAAVNQALTIESPLDPEALKAAVSGAARNLGPEGVKKGIATTMPLALGLMQAAGEIRRISVNGRLDQQRYHYALWKPSPLANWKLTLEESYIELARHYFRWIGCATAAEFQWFSGLGVNAAKAALAPLQLMPLDGGFLIPPEDRDAFEKFNPPKHPQYTLVASIDGMNQLRRNLETLLAPEDQDRDLVRGARGQPLQDLPHHAIFDRGRLAGLWQYDTATGAVAWTAFVKPDAALRNAVAKTEAFIREDLGDVRSFSLDSPRSRGAAIGALLKDAALRRHSALRKGAGA